MEKRIKNYLAFMEEQLKKDFSEAEKTNLMKDLLIQIGFFQHERLIHLLVTALFALLTFLCLLFNFVVPSIQLVLLVLILLLLLVPYIRHYYILENSVQKLYSYYDKLLIKSNRLN